MPKATTGAGLIQAANENFDKLYKTIDSLTAEQQETDFCYDADALTAKDHAGHWTRDKNLRDVLVHLYEWHQLLLQWEQANMNGENKPFLPPQYTWKNYMEMNIGFWQKHQELNWSLSVAKESLSNPTGRQSSESADMRTRNCFQRPITIGQGLPHSGSTATAQR